MLIVGWSSDRSGERRWHTALSLVVAGAGFGAAAAAGNQLALVIAAFCLVSAGGHAFFPSFWAMPTAFLTEAAAAATIGLINSFGNLGGFLGPYTVGYLKTRTGSFRGGLACLAVSMIVSGLLVLTLKPHHHSR
jgi:ACS family tartrate transporter-like MFS transporter